ncbi:MAG: CsgG/HfaB family protein [bacterium]
MVKFRFSFLILIMMVPLVLMGCAGTQVKVDEPQMSLPAYSGPKARIAVADFDVKVAKGGEEIGTGLREMLITTLIQSKRFSVLERQVLKALEKEQEIAGQKGKTTSADIIVTAAVTEFTAGASGVKGGVGGAVPGALMGVLAGMKKHHMALDIRIVDVNTSEVLTSTRVEGEARDVDLGALAGGLVGSGVLVGGLSMYKNTPMEKAIRICISEAVKAIINNTPPSYYKY